ncbi:importin subunit beta-like [Daphnia pulicaria]|uniref:importin subunit beta-like n=1 Tax=Daphnia pulicaria TaxID=35523 RepID=UPI001EEA4B0F|nr:importin subunit beta-like [Daphnia pulicaria]
MQCCGKFRENQKCAAQEALLDVLLNSPLESYESVERTIQTLIGKLCDGDAAADENYLPCTMLLRAMGRLRGHQMHHEFMRRLISILKSESPRGVLKDKKDAFLATSKTISLLPFDELKLHMLDLTTYLSSAIELPDPCPMVMSLIGDLFYKHSLFRKSLRYLDDFWLKFVDILARKDLHTKSRSICVATLNKMAQRENFSPYIVRTLKQLENAPSITVNQDPEHEELQENTLNLYYHLFKLIHKQVTQSRENRKQELDCQLSMMEKCLAGFSELMVAIVDEDTSDKIIIESAEHVGNILLELGIDEATKYLKSNLNLKWLLTSAAQRINSKEKNHNSSIVYSLHEALTLFTEEMPREHAQRPIPCTSLSWLKANVFKD